MGTGKTEVGRQLAQLLQWPFVDLDARIVKGAGKSIPKIFAQSGEATFRQLERRALAEVLKGPQAVVALGGGAVCSAANLKKLQAAGTLILLQAEVATLMKRLRGDKSRPLLKGGNPQEAIQKLLAERAPYYDAIPWQMKTEGKTPKQLARRIASLWPLDQASLEVSLGKRSYPIYFQQDGVKSLNSLLRRTFSGDRLFLLTNSVVDRLYGKAWIKELKREFRVEKLALPDGERHKNLATMAKIYRAMSAAGVDRKTPLLALGGGVIGDMGGYAAATYLRGVPYVQVPTTLLAQVDSSIGGKTGVDLPEGKNLVGAFYQPKMVLIDTAMLQTLKPRQLRCGMAEVIKYGAIFDAKLFRDLEARMAEYLKRPEDLLEGVIRRCCEWKAWVVREDEFETRGIRAKLNFGHSLGHAIETLTAYRRYTHGEAIAMGMNFAAWASQQRCGLSDQALRRLETLLQTAGLPTQWPDFSSARYLKALLQDKKRVSAHLNFVYLNKIGDAVVLPTPFKEIQSWL